MLSVYTKKHLNGFQICYVYITVEIIQLKLHVQHFVPV